MSDDWRDLPVLLACWRAGSLTEGARLLGVNHATASRRLAALEEKLGSRLFDRNPDGLAPTPIALELLPHAEAAEAAMTGFERAVLGLERGVDGPVRLATPDGFDSLLVAPHLVELFARHPGVALHLVPTPTATDLGRREAADLTLAFVRPTQGDLVARRLAELTQGVWGAPARVSEGLGRAPWIASGDPDATTAPWEQRHVHGAPRVRIHRLEARLAAARAGIGLTILPDLFARTVPELDDARTAEPVPSVDLWLVAHRALHAVPRVRAVWSFLVDLAERTLRE